MTGTETVDQLIERAQMYGWTEELAYRIAHEWEHRIEELRVCVLCGWYWISPSNRCVNPQCGGFCTWGESKDAEPDSWIKLPNGGYRPRMPGEPK